jgi:hypothetical protein
MTTFGCMGWITRSNALFGTPCIFNKIVVAAFIARKSAGEIASCLHGL